MNVLMYIHIGAKGLFLYTSRLSGALAAQGAGVTLLTTGDCKYSSDSIRILSVLKSLQTHPCYRCIRPLYVADRIWRNFHNCMKRSSVSRTLSPDIVHLQTTKPVLDRFFVPRLSRKFRTVLTVHDVVYHDETNINNRRQYLSRVYNSVHHLVVHTATNKEMLVEFFGVAPERISVIPHGADISTEGNQSAGREVRARLGIPTHAPLVMMFGTLRKNKGLDVLIRAFKNVVKRHPDARLLIVGRLPEGVSFASYERLVEEFRLVRNVIAEVRWIRDEELSEFFMASDIVALPYTSFASQSGVLFQAYRYRRPVVVTDVGGLSEAVREDGTGLVVGPGHEALTEGILEIIGNRERYKIFKANISRTRDKYAWNNVAKITMELYASLV